MSNQDLSEFFQEGDVRCWGSDATVAEEFEGVDDVRSFKLSSEVVLEMLSDRPGGDSV